MVSEAGIFFFVPIFHPLLCLMNEGGETMCFLGLLERCSRRLGLSACRGVACTARVSVYEDTSSYDRIGTLEYRTYYAEE